MSAAKLRILWLSENPMLATGFARVTREVVSRLAKHSGLEVACLGWGNPPPVLEGVGFPCRIYVGSARFFGQDVIQAAVDDFKPDLVITLGEIWMIGWLSSHPIRPRFKWIGYLPVDGGPFYPPWEPILSDMDCIVAMSHFGYGVLCSVIPPERVRVLYHGVDAHVFRPLADREIIKNHPRFSGKFVVGCVARNQARKNLPALVQAFAKLAAIFPDLHLYIHSTNCEGGSDLVELLKRFRLEGRADLAAPWTTVENGLSDVELNELYNLFDVMVLPTCAEGFGLPILESLSAGIPVVATDCSACTELVGGRGELARVLATLITGENLLEQAIVDFDDLARCIEMLYRAPELRKQYSTVGRVFAESLAWEHLMPQWLDVICGVLAVRLE